MKFELVELKLLELVGIAEVVVGRVGAVVDPIVGLGVDVVNGGLLVVIAV